MSVPRFLSKSLALAGLLLASTALSAAENMIEYPPVAPVVPFSSVTALDYATPAAMIRALRSAALRSSASGVRPSARATITGCVLLARTRPHPSG